MGALAAMHHQPYCFQNNNTPWQNRVYHAAYVHRYILNKSNQNYSKSAITLRVKEILIHKFGLMQNGLYRLQRVMKAIPDMMIRFHNRS
jgi:hypothetical protein